MLSISFLNASESIHRKTRIAGETMTTTEKKKATRPRRPRSPACPTGPVAALDIMASGPLRALPQIEKEEAQRHDDDHEDHDHRRGIADLIEGECLGIEVE